MNKKPIIYYFLALGISVVGMHLSGIDWDNTNHIFTGMMIFGLIAFGMWFEHYRNYKEE